MRLMERDCGSAQTKARPTSRCGSGTSTKRKAARCLFHVFAGGQQVCTFETNSALLWRERYEPGGILLPRGQPEFVQCLERFGRFTIGSERVLSIWADVDSHSASELPGVAPVYRAGV